MEERNSDIFSTIDRIIFSAKSLSITGIKSNWSLSLSDHAAVTVGLNLDGKNIPKKSRLVEARPKPC